MSIMLPDFPAPKAQLNKILMQRFNETREAEMGFLAEVRVFAVPEGDRLIHVDADGREDEVSFAQLSAEMCTSEQEQRAFSLSDVVGKVDQAAKDMARQMFSEFQSKFTAAVRGVGNDLNVHGQKLSPEHILALLERMSIEFDGRGQPLLPTFVIHPEVEPQLSEAITSLHDVPELRKQYSELIHRKREAWRARESSRKLVG